jgi:hypothetical protein
MGKQIWVREVLQAGGIIRRLVEGAGEVVIEADFAVETLVKGLEAEELGRGFGSGSATLPLPI